MRLKSQSFLFASWMLILFASTAALSQHNAPLQQVVPANPLKPAAPVQPLPYSHKRHLAMGLECKFCHVNPEPAARMTFPATSICMSCHQNISKSKPDLAKLAQYANSGEPIPWVRVYNLLPGPKWSHRTHLEAGAKCETCHGQVAKLDAMSEVTSVVTMYSCLNCHQANQAKTSCNSCHAWPEYKN